MSCVSAARALANVCCLREVFPPLLDNVEQLCAHLRLKRQTLTVPSSQGAFCEYDTFTTKTIGASPVFMRAVDAQPTGQEFARSVRPIMHISLVGSTGEDDQAPTPTHGHPVSS